MKAPFIVKAEIDFQRRTRLSPVRIRPQVDLLVLGAPPQALDKYVVDPSTLAVHADRDAGSLQRLDPILARELRSLVGVENLRPSVFSHRLLERFDTEVRRQRVRQPPGQHFSA